MEKVELKIKGMHCVSCENKVKEAVSSLKGVKDAKVDYASEKATVEFDNTKTDLNDIMKVIKNAGYEVETKKESKGLFKKIFG
jgi:Cu+-exporting ATPase